MKITDSVRNVEQLLTQDGMSDKEVLVLLLKNLLHYCNAKGIDYMEAYQAASGQVHVERAEQDEIIAKKD